MSDDDEASFLAEFEKERIWAKAHGISQRTSARYRNAGLPYLEWGGEIYIPRDKGREFIHSKVRRKNPGGRRGQR